MYDIIILGSGPAGLTAAIYAARGGMNVAVVENAACGGQTLNTSAIENFPGVPAVDGFTLAMTMQQQAESFGAKFVFDQVKSVALVGDIKQVVTEYSGVLESRTIIIATGASPKKLLIENEAKLTGRGVSYCATCDGALYRNKKVLVVGGGNTAVTDAIYLKNFAAEVYIVHRRTEFRAAKVLVDKMLDLGVKVVTPAIITALNGLPLSSVDVKSLSNDSVQRIEVNGLFVAVGTDPATSLFEGQLAMEGGYIVTDEEMHTAIDGVFAAGDLRKKSLRQVVTACADGAIAAEEAIKAVNSRL